MSLQQHLGLADLSDVEEWLVRAMGKKLIEGQMDQVKQQVIITKSSYRTFGPEHWQILQNQLAAWKVTLLPFWLNNHGTLSDSDI